MSSPPVKFTAKECPIETVTVYNNQAEVARVLRWKPAEEHYGKVIKLKIDGLGQTVPDSVRIDARKGDFVLKEVASGYEPVSREEYHTDEEVQTWLSELEQCNVDLAILQTEKKSLVKSTELLDEFCVSLMGVKKTIAEPSCVPLLNMNGEDIESSFARVSSMIDQRNTKVKDYDQAVIDIAKKTKTLKERIQLLKEKISNRTGIHLPDNLVEPSQIKDEFLKNIQQAPMRTIMGSYVSILIEVSPAKPNISSEDMFEMGVSYLVYASWSASYDLRLHWINKTEQPRMELTYFGSVRQNTGENWEDIRLILSTAEPSLFGAPPPLPRLRVEFKQEAHLFKRKSFGPAMMLMKSARAGATANLEASEEAFIDRPVVMTAVQENAGSHANFVIPAVHTIPSDGDPHKTTIGMIDLPITTHYYATPEVSKNVFLAAAIENKSEYTLVPSDEVSVYFERSFITKTHMPIVAPNESFTVFVGNDPRVKIDKTPIQKLRKSIGVLQKSFRDVYETTMHVHNTKEIEVELVIVIRVPGTTDEKIKVVIEEPPSAPEEISLQEDSQIFGSPQLAKPAKNGTEWFLNKQTNNVLCRVLLKSNEKRPITFGYFIESPQDKEVVVVSS